MTGNKSNSQFFNIKGHILQNILTSATHVAFFFSLQCCTVTSSEYRHELGTCIFFIVSFPQNNTNYEETQGQVVIEQRNTRQISEADVSDNFS